MMVGKFGTLDIQELRDISERSITLIKLTLGNKFAERKVLESVLDLSDDTSTLEADPLEIGINDFSLGASADDIITIQKNQFVKFSDEAQLLLSSYFSEPIGWKRFLYGWMAFEVLVGTGKKREAWCLTQTKSQRINSEVFRLFLLRGVVAHKGHTKIGATDHLSLLCIIKMAAVAPGAGRTRYIELFDKYLTERNKN